MKNIDDSVLQKLYLKDTVSLNLMQRRIFSVRLIATHYDAVLRDNDIAPGRKVVILANIRSHSRKTRKSLST